jgi:hypothetical protein
MPEEPRYCAMPGRPPRVVPPDLSPGRYHAMLVGGTKWANETVLHYFFFDRASDVCTEHLSAGTSNTYSYVGDAAQKGAVRDAFTEWKNIGIGLEFVEVGDRSEAELRIGFAQDGQSVTCGIGRDILKERNPDNPTTNFGWDLTDGIGYQTALHEIGHMLGLGHEHQSPFAGLEWDEEAVYAHFLDKQGWDRATTLVNVLEKVDPGEVDGSQWDPDSIMEYAFPARLITHPQDCFDTGVTPPGTLSPADKAWVQRWYPPSDGAPPVLAPLTTATLPLKVGEQADFTLEPPGTRRYTAQTVGDADCVLTLFEDDGGQLRYLAGDDDSGTDRNAQITEKLLQGREYVLRARVNWIGISGMAAVMYA